MKLIRTNIKKILFNCDRIQANDVLIRVNMVVPITEKILKVCVRGQSTSIIIFLAKLLLQTIIVLHCERLGFKILECLIYDKLPCMINL